MILKEDNKHYEWEGFCSDWDTNTHWGVYDNKCTICKLTYEDREEFLELTCTHLFHTHCLESIFSGEDLICDTC